MSGGPAAALTARRLNRASLARQRLLRREAIPVDRAVGRVVGLQAQEPASPYLALWSRLAGFDPADLDAAFANGTIVKSSLMRITLHAVAAEDHPIFHAAMARSLRASRLYDRRFTSTGSTIEDADALAPEILAFASEPRSNAEMETFAVEHLGPERGPRTWWAIRTFASLRHAPSGGPWSFGRRPSYVAVGEQDLAPDRGTSIQALVMRYLAAFGPASVQDLAQFTLLTRATAREAIAALGASVRTLEGPNGRELFDVHDGLLPPEDTPVPPRLMAMWDSLLLAYSDRSRVIPPEYRRLVIRSNGDVLPTILVDGHVAGVWRPADDGIEISAFHPLPDDTWEGLASEARALVMFLADREPTVYRRYSRWWATLPAVEVRQLPG